MKKNYLLCLLAFYLFALSGQANHLRPNLLFGAKLEGAQETPPVSTPGLGVGSCMLNSTRDTMFVNLSVTGLTSAITGAHIHQGLPGVAGPVVFNLMPFLTGNRITGYLSGSDFNAATIAKFLNGEYYFNVHTTNFPNGEVRGQILLETELGFIAMMDGAQETPPVTTPAAGIGAFMLLQDMSKIKMDVVFEGLSSAVTGAHLHVAPRGVAGPVVLPLTTMVSGNRILAEGDPTAFLTALLTGNIYINIHTVNFPNGEIRGHLMLQRGLLMDAHLDGGQETPPVATNAFGVAGVKVNATLDSLQIWSLHSGLSGPITGAHFHTGAVGVAGPVAISLNNLISGNKVTGKLPLAGFPANTLQMFLEGNMYLNVHTAANPAGEIRGQVYRLAREGYTMLLSGKQETPPVTTTGSGSGLVSVDRDQTNAHFMAVWSGLSGPATAAHFHRAPIGVAGPVVLNLAPYFNNAANPTAAFGYWNSGSTPPFTLRNSVQFRTDSIYLNVHTAAFPAGEIRSQAFRGAPNLSRILSVKPSLPAIESASLFPNPSERYFTWRMNSNIPQGGVVKVTDALGRVVYQQEKKLNKGDNELRMDLGNLPKGIYQLEYSGSGLRSATRLIKL